MEGASKETLERRIAAFNKLRTELEESISNTKRRIEDEQFILDDYEDEYGGLGIKIEELKGQLNNIK